MKPTTRTISENESRIILDLEWHGKKTVSLGEIQEALQTSDAYARFLAHKLVAKGWLERGVSVLLVDYRGYGKSQGKIEKVKDLMMDAEAALAWLVNEQKISPDKIILYGESIGSYPAAQLARQKKIAGLVLEAPFTTLAELANKHYQGVPEFLLKDFSMNNPEAIRKAQAPVFVMHGAEDEICPREMGERIYECAPSPKELYVVPGGSHNDLPAAAGKNYFEYPYRFLAKENGFVS